ncbi:G-type lectin S-receptor-like serine/threonine-protein kinase LECRK3 [Mangifera indica]|uniref:G-type lectin S-receptor-like serine/threonine-protein kinase LECRK3 n=1 Tax=Mangifera indica TaxID=29780 RepID=UPI001CFC2E2B|nr:G-type lectin S-receptor-like serine/threonine-protein kinase LECRK3 [Mangifera indica]
MAYLPLPTLILLCLLQWLPCLSAANISVGLSLSTTGDNSSWLSPLGNFAFGFRQLNNSNHFLLAIWFNKIPENTIVWYADGDNPAPRGSKVEFSTQGLLLKDPENQTIWSTSPSTDVADEAAMLDTGNFVLIGNDSNYVWQSFKDPRDTILPTQRLDLGSMLISKLTETNFSKGRFELHFTNGSLELNPVAWPTRFNYKPYYSSNTYSENSSESGHQLVFNESADIYILKTNEAIVQLPSWTKLTNPSSDYYYRATLDFDGSFIEYAYAKTSDGNQGWWPLRGVPQNMCLAISQDIGRGGCGFNSYCTIENGRYNCSCPPGYVFVDPTNRFSDCRPTFRQGCEPNDGSRDPEELYEIKEFNDLNWPLGDYERLEPYDQTMCEKDCLHDCSCAVAIFGGTKCWKKRLPLSNGRFEPNTFTKALFKVRKGDSPEFVATSGSNKGKLTLLGALLLGGSVFFNVLLLVAFCLILFVLLKRKSGNYNFQDSTMAESNLRFFTYNQLSEATDDFKEELGRGSFGIVYKGVFKTGSGIAIAVKKLDKLAQEREREFKTEVSAIGRIHHKNLVQLLGYCDEGTNRLLVYEFMSNGTLANILFALPKPDWNLRVRISLEIARGLVYLHEECNVPIIHCDIKPQNILLDHYFNAKISDFGLSKLLLSDQSRTRTMIRGTRGYVAPEWFKNVAVSAKVDVYSYGVMLLEIICCRRCVEMEAEEERREILIDWVYDCYVEGRLDVLVNEDETALADKCRLQKWLMVAIWCIQEDPSERPTMKMMLHMLEGYLEVPKPPCPYSFSLS